MSAFSPEPVESAIKRDQANVRTISNQSVFIWGIMIEGDLLDTMSAVLDGSSGLFCAFRGHPHTRLIASTSSTWTMPSGHWNSCCSFTNTGTTFVALAQKYQTWNRYSSFAFSIGDGDGPRISTAAP